MQVQLQAIRRARSKGSLRSIVTNDRDKGKHKSLFVERFKSSGRSPGWAKVKAVGVPGAINLEWDESQRMLTVRAICRGKNRPHQLLGVFLEYLLQKHGHRLTAINMQLA